MLSSIPEKETAESDWEVQRALQIEKDKEAGRNAISMITDACNHGANNEVVAGMVGALIKEHRTLQQDFWRAIKEVAIQYAEFAHDLRNEEAVEMCKKIKAMDIYLPRV